ncbi:zinc ABC transporter substrate-binding protein [Pseudolysinimonas kribbensis]|uniref:Metal ABC transporter substrate-binding protein n=1 Tax=Pseudolysinimonas kribbensis TaxID=433641 RepID=A0ABQ6K8A2_9MICO|nr:zinc ABC transporter substrate-binding protein [Pseudolysinimonas kribbensis]GMA95200.1 metal ABC transporter substrate-binding protein [Pseudolysinimonas kribbensis]
MPRRALAALAALAVLAALAGCSGGAAASASGAAGTVPVVASTDVYGDIAKAIGGAHVTVTSIIDDPDKDPHEYQADARTQLAISRAKVVIENGGGYDDFVDTMLKASKNTKAFVVNAVKLSGFSGADLNEHVWYDYPTMSKVVDAIAASLHTADPKHARAYSAGAEALQQKLTRLEDSEATLAASTTGVGAGITEPVPDYVLQALKMDIVTPPAFSKAIEDGTDVAPVVLQQTLAQYADGRVKVLVYNVQTGGPQTEAVLAAAKKHHVPAVPVSETLPEGLHYIEWQEGVLAAIAQAVTG